MNQQKMEILLSARNGFQTTMEIIDGIMRGESEASACRKHNVTQATFRNQVEIKPIIETQRSNKEIKKSWREPYQRLYCDIFNLETLSEEQINALPVDFNETVRKVIKNFAMGMHRVQGRRMKKIFCMYYLEEMTLQEIANNFSLTRERIRQIIRKALRMMRIPKIGATERLVLGDKYIEELQKRYPNNYKEVIEIHRAEHFKIHEEAFRKQKEAEEQKAMYKGMSIYELAGLMKLKRRAYNCIVIGCPDDANAYQYLSSLKSIDKIMALKNVGKKSADEIARALHEVFGFSVKKKARKRKKKIQTNNKGEFPHNTKSKNNQANEISIDSNSTKERRAKLKETRVGEVSTTAKDIDVQFEDSAVKKGVRYGNFKTGNVRHPNSSNPNRQGETSVASNGMTMTIIAYRCSSDIDVQFEDGAVRENVAYHCFKKGQIRHPYVMNHIGEVSVSSDGLSMLILRYRGYDDMDVWFEDGAIQEHVSYASFKNGTIEHPKGKGKEL